ncbi:MAG: IS91 family transposase [Gemmatimonadaceae bacterium]
MLELADIVRVTRVDYETRHARELLPSQRRAMTDIVRCRTPALGGSVFRCDECGTLEYAYHSCRNRHCPKCQDEREQEWLTAVRARMLPSDHYLVTCTLPAQLRTIAARHQHVVYSALFHAAAAAVQTLAHDRRWIGGTPGIVSVLHTWTRTLEYHPHAHLIVTAGGLSADGTTWVQPAHERFLMPGRVLAPLVRRAMRATLAKAGLLDAIPPSVWARHWVVHVQQIGRGDQALRYLARYVFHVALSNTRIDRFADGRVTFRYTHAETGETRRLTLPVDTFLHRFLQHVLPARFVKIRYYGLLSPTARLKLEAARRILHTYAAALAPTASTPVPKTDPHLAARSRAVASENAATPQPALRSCRHCHRGVLRLVSVLARERGPP